MNTQLNAYLEAIKEDYKRWGRNPKDDAIMVDIKFKHFQEFCTGLRIQETLLYFKVFSGNSIHSFIVKADGPKFKQGDILKAASWKAPAKNQARGNLFTGYHINWEGPDYLR